MSVEDIRSEQDNEFTALQSIFFPHEIKDLRKPSVWGNWQPLHLILYLSPQQGSATLDHAKVELHVECCELYPNRSPTLSIRNPHGISQHQSQMLLTELNQYADNLKGRVMIWQLAIYTREFLYKNSKPATKSCYEEMMQRQEKQLQEQQEKEDRKQKMFLKEHRKRQELHKQANKKYRTERKLSENSLSGNTSANSAHAFSSREPSDEMFCIHEKQLIEFTNPHMQIIRGQCVEHANNSIMYISMEKEFGHMYHLTQWVLEDLSEKISIEKQLEHELKILLKLNHQNLINYINFYLMPSETKITINLLSEFVAGSSCYALYILNGIQVEIAMLRHIALNTLKALEYLHNLNIIHKNLCASCVYITDTGDVKLMNQNIHQRLNDLVSDASCQGLYNKRTDIFKFGILILSLIKGTNVDENQFSIPHETGVELRDFIEKCILKDQNRYSSNMLLEHSFLKTSAANQTPIKKPAERSPSNAFESQSDDIALLVQPTLNGGSRVDSEFELLEMIGKGGYGEVFKVRNKLDRRLYALKRIELNSKNKGINRKLIREVKLLSRLNHENVVRYYNSWIETVVATICDSNESETRSSSSSPTIAGKIKRSDSIDSLLPQVKWSVSFGNTSSRKQNLVEDESDDESDSEFSSPVNNLFSESSSQSDDSDFIAFEADGDAPKEPSELVGGDEVEEDECEHQLADIPRKVQIMYIQMEFCERSTLEQAIENNLYLEQERLWCLFREIIEGLTYIHQQGMIHRDLKPGNIFLDAEGHVKIGDFGLATSSLHSTRNESSEDKSQVSDADVLSLTGHIGTALYVAPEVRSTAKSTYDQKVDIYSLGIIFFEMCYRKCGTNSERISILLKLRTESVQFPADFDDIASSTQKFIIKWLLDHKSCNRPSSQELLESEYIPPPVLAERELRELIRHTLKEPQQKAYKYLVESCLTQPITLLQDISYDENTSPGFSLRSLQIFNHVRELVVNIFQLHGAQALSTPLLMPENKYYHGVKTSVRLMTHSGSVVTIPHDLRVPFARYVARNGINSLRRYSIDRVFREKRVFGFHPQVLYECAFDIVTPMSGNLMANAEVLHVLDDIATIIPDLNDNSLAIKLNHTSLLKAILLHCNIKDNHSQIYSVLADARGKVAKPQVRIKLNSNGVSDKDIEKLDKLFSHESTIDSIRKALQPIIKRRNTDASGLTEQALKDLQSIIDNAKQLGVTTNIVVNLGLVFRVSQYSGMLCQLVMGKKEKHKSGPEILAAGGRYDDLITDYKSRLLAKDCQQSAVGVSLSLDRLVQIFTGIDHVLELDAVVGGCYEIGDILRCLRSLGLKAHYVPGTTMQEISRQAEELNALHAIFKDRNTILYQQNRGNNEKLQKFSRTEDLFDHFQRVVKIGNENSVELSTSSSSLQRLDSRSSHSDIQPNMNIVIINEAGKMPPHIRKRYEATIKYNLNEVCKKVVGEVIVFAMNLESDVICSMACYFNFESDEEEFNKSVESVKERHQKYKKYLDQNCKKIYDAKCKSNNPAIFLFSLLDSGYRVCL